MPFHEKKHFFSPQKVNFSMIFSLFHCFCQKINKKHWVLWQYPFFWKKFINNLFFNVFRRFTTFKGKPSLLRKKKRFNTKSHFFLSFSFDFSVLIKKKGKYTLYIFYFSETVQSTHIKRFWTFKHIV